MTRPSFSPSLCGLAWGLLLFTASSATADEPGVVRIRKPATQVTVRAQSEPIELAGAQSSYDVDDFSDCDCDECRKGFGLGKRFHGSDDYYYDSNGRLCRGKFGGKHGAIRDYFLCKFGYFVPTGCGGAGCPPFGRYARVYPQDPSYFDQRDGQVFAAPGYGMPIAVPLAPVVGHQYNYGWGVPSSRLTPISRVAPY